MGEQGEVVAFGFDPPFFMRYSGMINNQSEDKLI